MRAWSVFLVLSALTCVVVSAVSEPDYGLAITLAILAVACAVRDA